MLRIKRKVFERVILQIIDSADMRELLSEFSRDTRFFYSIMSDISRGKDSPNYPIIEKIAVDRRVNEEFIVQQARSLLSLLAPERPKEDYYGILGVHPTADSREIRKSWLRLVTAYHPDRVGDEGLGITKKLNEAYEVLRDPVRRSDYDSKFPHASPVVVVEPWRARLAQRGFAYSALAVVLILAMASSLIVSKSVFHPDDERGRLVRRIEDRSGYKDRVEDRILVSERPPIPKASKSPLSNIHRGVIYADLTGLKEDKKTKEAPKLAYKEPPPRPKSDGMEESASIHDEKKGVLISQVKEEKGEGVYKESVVIKKKTLEGDPVKYVVKKGDNLWGIARAFNTSAEDLKAINNLSSNRLDVGDVLVIYSTKREKPLKEVSTKGNVEKKKVKESAGKLVETKQANIRHENREQEKGVSQPAVLKEPDRESLYSFISEYVSAYKSRNMPRFVSFFAPDARENGVEISKAITSYRRNFSSLDIIQYDVRVSRVDVRGDRASIDGDFTMTFKKRSEEKVKRSRGEISWLLSWDESGWRIKEINYRLRGREADEG